MQEFLWEIWIGKRNMHHRTQMSLDETPREVFHRILDSLKGTDKEIGTRTVDPNTGREVDLQWRFAWRSQQQEANLQGHIPFARQGVPEGAVFVVRQVSIRAMTLYVDGIEGLGSKEMAAAKPKAPYILSALLLLALLGGAAYYFLVFKPAQDATAPTIVQINTTPKGTKVSILMDMRKVKGAKDVFKAISSKKGTPAKLAIPKNAKIVKVSLSFEGYKPWQKGHENDAWQKDQAGEKKLKPIAAKTLSTPDFFPPSLEKAPAEMKKPKKAKIEYKDVPGPKPKMLKVKYPRKKPRTLQIGLDPARDKKDLGPVGLSGRNASTLNLLLSKVIQRHLNAIRVRRRRPYRVALARSKKKETTVATRAYQMRRAKVIIQLDLASGLEEQKEGVKSFKKGKTEFKHNDTVAGFQIFWSEKERKSKEPTTKLAKCLGTALKAAGFHPRAPRKGEKVTDKDLGIRPLTGEVTSYLEGKVPAIRVVIGYLTHRAEEKALLNLANHQIIARAFESALICWQK